MFTPTFEWALMELKRWKLMTRNWWNWKNQYIWLQTPTETSKMTLPYLYINTIQWDLVPWTPNQTDLLSEDWAILGMTGQW